MANHEFHDREECLEDMVIGKVLAKHRLDRAGSLKERQDFEGRVYYWDKKIENRLRILESIAHHDGNTDGVGLALASPQLGGE